MKCPKCSSDNVVRYIPHAVTCDSCGYNGNGQEFGEHETPRYDHAFEPGAYGVCRRCGGERH